MEVVRMELIVFNYQKSIAGKPCALYKILDHEDPPDV